mmetsp:Transcript_13243/g.37395  ORF Transcript_13243/g.37395 Transcript_13243/m.37395 type:complete len:211 (-) Transcript_13243:6044-6676(-)
MERWGNCGEHSWTYGLRRPVPRGRVGCSVPAGRIRGPVRPQVLDSPRPAAGFPCTLADNAGIRSCVRLVFRQGEVGLEAVEHHAGQRPAPCRCAVPGNHRCDCGHGTLHLPPQAGGGQQDPSALCRPNWDRKKRVQQAVSVVAAVRGVRSLQLRHLLGADDRQHDPVPCRCKARQAPERGFWTAGGEASHHLCRRPQHAILGDLWRPASH